MAAEAAAPTADRMRAARLTAVRGRPAGARSAPGQPGLLFLRFAFSAPISGGHSSPREMNPHQTTVTFTQGTGDFTKGLR
jgi:hypothetical protein